MDLVSFVPATLPHLLVVITKLCVYDVMSTGYHLPLESGDYISELETRGGEDRNFILYS